MDEERSLLDAFPAIHLPETFSMILVYGKIRDDARDTRMKEAPGRWD